MSTELKISKNVRTIAITCLQFGDTGKGKVIDLLSGWADVIVRGTGGANAGHSVCLGDQTFIFHIIPCGILYDEVGKFNIVGSGTAVDPRIFCEEVALLRRQGLSFKHLMLALNAKLTLPTQIVRDRIGEGESCAGRIGTTGRGIGPTYADHALRIGLVVNDLLNPDILAAKVKLNAEFSARILRSYDPETVRTILSHPNLGSGAFYHPGKIFNVDAIVQAYLGYGDVLSQFICDTDLFVQDHVGGSKLLLEGAQGTFLDVDHGTRPFTTSTSCTVDGLAKGAGLNRSNVDLSLGVMKGFYMTRVGEGPFPTELGGNCSADWCRKSSREKEKADYAGTTVNDTDEFRQGVALRIVGGEYGATTGRPRRTGWLDLPLLRYALRWGSLNVVLTKLDVLDDCEVIKVCTHHNYVGNPYFFGDHRIMTGEQLSTAIPAAEFLEHCKPLYKIFPGWKKSLKGITSFEDLPKELKDILSFVVEETKINPKIISVGPDREETIFV